MNEQLFLFGTRADGTDVEVVERSDRTDFVNASERGLVSAEIWGGSLQNITKIYVSNLIHIEANNKFSLAS